MFAQLRDYGFDRAQRFPIAAANNVNMADDRAGNFGRYLRRLMRGYEEEFGLPLSQIDVTNALAPLTSGTVNKWWLGLKWPGITSCYAIAHLFGRPIEETVVAAGHSVITFQAFLSDVTENSKRWRDQAAILALLRPLATPAWERSPSFHVVQAHQAMIGGLSLRERAQLVALSVYSWELDPQRDDPVSAHTLPLDAAS